MRIQETDFESVSEAEGIDIALLKTIMQVESNGSGHLPAPDNRPKILFEGHLFYKNLSPAQAAKWSVERPDLCHKSWTKTHYKGGAKEWERLASAVSIDREAALKSASWGAFQILGQNHKACGFDTVQSFVNAMFKEERHHLQAVCKFIKAHPTMYRALLRQDWKEFARRYNGPGYSKNSYDLLLAKAYAKFSK
jgi:hypothetical protein